MSWYDSGQEDQNVRYWLLDSAHGSYETRRAAIQSLSPNYAIANGSVANTKVVTGYATDGEIVSNSLDIGGAVLDRVHHFINPNAAAASIYTNTWGDKFRVWGKFLRQPDPIPTTGIDAIVTQWKTAPKTIMYAALAAAGTGSGSSYLNRKALADFTGTVINYDILVLCGNLSAGTSINFYPKTGTALARTQVVSHPVDQAALFGGRTFTSWTNEGGGVWSKNTGLTVQDTYIVTSFGGTRRGLTKVASQAACAALADSSYVSGSTVYVNVGGDPAGNTYVITSSTGLLLTLRTTAYVDFFGLEIWGISFSGSYNGYYTDLAFYAMKFECGDGGFSMLYHGCNTLTGRFQLTNTNSDNFAFTLKPWIRRNLIVQGCQFKHQRQIIYDSTQGTDSGFGFTFKDNYCYKINADPTQNLGYDRTINADSHTCAVYGGADGMIAENNSLEKAGNQNFVVYNVQNTMYPPERVLSDGAFTNGAFTTDLTGWTDNDTGTGVSSQTGGKLRLNGGASGVAKRTQAVTIGAGFVGDDENGIARHQVIRIETGSTRSMFDFDTGPYIYIDVGTTSGANDLFSWAASNVTADHDGIAAIWFVPTGTTFYVSLYNPANSDLDIDKVTLLQDLTQETGFLEGGYGYTPSGFFEPAGAGALASPFLNMKILWSRTTNCRFNYNWIRDPIVTGGDNGPGVGVDLGGDFYTTGPNGRQSNIEIAYNRIEGTGAVSAPNFEYGGIRTKFKPWIGALHANAPSFDTIHIHHNVIRGTRTGFFASSLSNHDEDGTLVCPSYKFNDNDVHAVESYLLLNEVGLNPGTCIHKVDLRDNTYRTQSGVVFSNIGGITTSLTTFKTQALSGDVLELNSIHVAFTTDTGSPTLTISGTTTLSGSFGADPDGALSTLDYQWFVDGELIEGEEDETSFDASGYADGSEVALVGGGQDAKGKWFLVTSNTVTLTAGSGMGADTAAKRLSAMNMACPWRGTAYPTGTINDSERAAVLFLYSGFDYAADDGGGSIVPGAKRGGFLVNIGKMMT